jgi:hypothetical protein
MNYFKKMEEIAKNPPPPPPPPDPNKPREKSLVDRLCEGDHPVEVTNYLETLNGNYQLRLRKMPI